MFQALYKYFFITPYLVAWKFWHGRKGRNLIFFLTWASIVMAIEDHVPHRTGDENFYPQNFLEIVDNSATTSGVSP